MKTDRPVNLALTKFSFPLVALGSIAHRITGMLLFVGIAYLLWLLDMALASPAGLIDAQSVLGSVWPKLVLLAVLACLIYHLLAGIKHMFLDFHVGDSLVAAKATTQAVVVLTVVAVVAAGVWLW